MLTNITIHRSYSIGSTSQLRSILRCIARACMICLATIDCFCARHIAQPIDGELSQNGELALNTKENISVFRAHFNKVLNNHRPVDYSVLDLLKQKPCLTLINNPITFSKVKRAINKLKKGKSPGFNGIPPKAFKAMANTPQRTVHRLVCDFFKGKVDHEGWHKSQFIPLPKQGNLSDPNKWQGIMLMDMCSRVFLSVMMA